MDIFIASEQVVNRLKFDFRCCGEGGYKYKILMLLIINISYIEDGKI